MRQNSGQAHKMNQAVGKVVMTVLGPIPAEECGITSCHEHLIFDPGWGTSSDFDYDRIMYDVELQIEELAQYKAVGGQTIVSMTNIGIGRDPLGLQRISESTGIHVVMGTGWYLPEYYPHHVREKLPDQLAEVLVREITEGVGGTAIRAGIIGEIGTGRRFVKPEEERVLRAAARAQRQTGVAISTHTTHFGELALEQISILEEEQVDPNRIIIGHLGDRRGIEMLLPIARRGVWLQIDNIGWLNYTTDEQRARNISDLAEAGYLDRILLGTDICLNSSLVYYGGRGYGHLLRTFVPLLQDARFSESEIRTMLVDNPREALAFSPAS